MIAITSGFLWRIRFLARWLAFARASLLRGFGLLRAVRLRLPYSGADALFSDSIGLFILVSPDRAAS
jgi:hypothetical protein